MTERPVVVPVCPRCEAVGPTMSQSVPAWTEVRGVGEHGTVIGRIEAEEFGSVWCHECEGEFSEDELVAASFGAAAG